MTIAGVIIENMVYTPLSVFTTRLAPIAFAFARISVTRPLSHQE
jgi:hypothetical protein